MYCSSSASPPPTAPSSVVRVRLSACKRRLGRLPEGQLALWIAIDDDVIALVELALEHRQRQRILQQPLNRPLEWPRAERGIVPLGREHLPRRRCQLERETALGEKLLESVKLEIDDVLDLRFAEWPEDDDVIDPVEKLGTEVLAERARDLGFDDRAVFTRVLEDVGAADVRRHDDDGVPEIDGAALRIGESPIVENLEQNVEHVRMRLLDLVEQHDGVRAAANRLSKLTALLEADVARRRADQSGDRVFLHVLGHVDADHRLLVVEQEFCESARGLRFSDAGGAEEDERADGTIGILQSSAGAADGVRHGF